MSEEDVVGLVGSVRMAIHTNTLARIEKVRDGKYCDKGQTSRLTN